jgi:regulatory protein YycH of two-component signal transduction system YycFG
MTTEVPPGIRERLRDPDSGERVKLLVEVASVSGSVVDHVEHTGADVIEELPLGYLVVDAPEESLDELCGLDPVVSVEVDGRGSVMESDFPTRNGSVL